MYLTTSIRIILYITYGIRAGFYLDSNFFLRRLLTFSSSLFFSHLFLCVKMDASTNSATFPAVTSAAETVVSTTNSPLHINMSNIIKLFATNYLVWSRQVHALLDGYELAHYLDESSPAPDATITTADITTPNPYFLLWKRQDKLIFSALLGAISQNIQLLVSMASTSANVWKTLASTYAKPTRGHIKQLLNQIKQ